MSYTRRVCSYSTARYLLSRWWWHLNKHQQEFLGKGRGFFWDSLRRWTSATSNNAWKCSGSDLSTCMSAGRRWIRGGDAGGAAQLWMNSTPYLTVCVEGNIGSGKTTFLKHFKQFPQVCVLDEPISKWRDVRGHNLLDLMYKDPNKWSLCFQSYVQLTMLDLHTKPVNQPFKMMERSIFSAKYCFVENLRNEGFMKDAEYDVLTEWFNFVQEKMPLKVDLIVYLRTDPEVAFERIMRRGRSEENSISLDYLQSVHDLHEDWLIRKKKIPCPVLTINANTDLSLMAPSYSLCEDTIFKANQVANAVK